MKKFLAFWHEKPKTFDAVILSLFTFLITFQPFFLHGRINIFEVGLYLPGINAILHNGIPFRDFFHLRGPFELYIPACWMQIFGAHIGVMYIYFYAGTILGLILCVLIAREIYQTRYVLYLLVPVLVARTFPRVVYYFWGGLRYAAGLLALFCAIKFFKKERSLWIFLAGVSTSIGFFISAEIGFCSAAGIVAAFIFSFIFGLQKKSVILRGVLFYALGAASVAVPFACYLLSHQALSFYIESMHAVVTNMQNVIDPHLVSIYPRNMTEAVAAMVNPLSKNFRHMTPSYLYLFLFILLFYRAKTRTLTKIDISIVSLAVYGIIMYNSSFRGIWAAQFEMALQPEKILFFFLLGEIYLFLRRKKDQLRSGVSHIVSHGNKMFRARLSLSVIYFLFAAFFMSCLFYSMERYQKRFTAYQILQNLFAGKSNAELMSCADEPHQMLTIARAKGIIVPKDQAQELEEVIPLIERLTKPGEIVFTYPEIGTYNFLADRPFLGRFPLVTFSWFNDQWHKEIMADLKAVRPKIVILTNDLPEDWKIVYLTMEKNRQKYDEVMAFIDLHYQKIATTRHSYVYQLKEK